MAGRWFLIGLAVLTGCCFITANVQAGLVDADLVTSPLLAWDGFEDDFSPDWEGDTTVVDTWPAWQAPENNGTSGWTSSGTMLATNWHGGCFVAEVDWNPGHWVESGGHWETHPTVRNASASSDSTVSSSAWLRFAGREYTATKNDDDGLELARYARLLSPEGKLLADASAVAYGNTSFGSDEFSADGRVSALAILTTDAEEAVAGSTGRSWFEAAYELGRDTDFSFELDLAFRGEVDFSFTATDVDSGEVALYFDTIPNAIGVGTQQTFSLDGFLEAGVYEFALNCLTDGAVNSLGQWNPGGQAIYDLSLDLKEEYVQVWVPDYVWVSGFGYLSLDTSNSPAAVPEPSTLAMLILGGLGCLIAGRWRRQAA
jgi:hypothetical protein